MRPRRLRRCGPPRLEHDHRRRGGSGTALALAVLGVMTIVVPARAQLELPVVDTAEDVPFHRPEAWAMQYFGSVGLFTPLGPPRAREPGSIELGLEVTHVPYLSEEQRRVGFNGVKVEDLNRLPVFVRPRVTIGLPHRFSVEVGYVPPVEIDGIEPELLSLAVERELYSGERWLVGARLHGQIGGVEGELTCSSEDASHEPGSPENRFGCLAPSNDESTLDHVALHVGAGYRLRSLGRSTVLFGAGVARHDLEFRVDAFTYDIHDRTRLSAAGTTWSLDAGLSIPVAERADLGIDALWTPLEVVRPPRSTAENDDLFHLKAMVRYRLR